MLESENRQKNPIRVILINQDGTILIVNSAKDFLPFGFGEGFARLKNRPSILDTFRLDDRFDCPSTRYFVLRCIFFSAHRVIIKK
jgi:hypothetical protein